MNGANIIISIVALIAAFLLMSLLIMLTWNKGVKAALKPGAVQRIMFTEAMALTAFIMLVSGGCTVVAAPPMKQAMSNMPSAASMFR